MKVINSYIVVSPRGTPYWRLELDCGHSTDRDLTRLQRLDYNRGRTIQCHIHTARKCYDCRYPHA